MTFVFKSDQISSPFTGFENKNYKQMTNIFHESVLPASKRLLHFKLVDVFLSIVL